MREIGAAGFLQPSEDLRGDEEDKQYEDEDDEDALY